MSTKTKKSARNESARNESARNESARNESARNESDSALAVDAFISWGAALSTLRDAKQSLDRLAADADAFARGAPGKAILKNGGPTRQELLDAARQVGAVLGEQLELLGSDFPRLADEQAGAR